MAPAPRSHLILGGARSGKSRYAVELARRARTSTAVIATARDTDDDMRARIARHRAERPPDWITVEEPIGVPAACRALAGRVGSILVDCVTVWVSNLLARGDGDAAILESADELADVLRDRSGGSILVVSNEVGEGVHPPTAIGLRFRDLLGSANQRLAAAADRVTLMVAGLPVPIKPAGALAARESES